MFDVVAVDHGKGVVVAGGNQDGVSFQAIKDIIGMIVGVVVMPHVVLLVVAQ